MAMFVGPLTAQFRSLHPEIRFDYVSAEQRLDLAKGEADVAFRADGGVDGGTLIRVALPDVAWSFYCAEDYRASQGMPSRPAELIGHRVVRYAGPVARLPVSDFLMAHACEANIVATSNSVPSMAGTIRAGHGVGMLPCVYGDQLAGLVRCFDPPAEMVSPLWIVASGQAHQLPHVRSFVTFAAAAMRAKRAMLSGRADAVT